MYYRIKENKLYDNADYRYNDECLETNIITSAELRIHPNKVIISNGILILNPDYEEEEAQKREADFKAKFFKVGNYGYYRREPKGYQSAVESMNVLFNVANITKGVQEGLIIFYQEPDFTKPEQCTEEWLVEHQIIMPALTLEQFLQLYVAFMTAWNTEEHNESTTNTNYVHIGDNTDNMEVTTNNDESINIEDINESTTDNE